MKYTRTHEWIKEADTDLYVVGITNHAQEQLSDVVYVELPEVGKAVTAGEPMLAIDSVKAASDIYAPVTGEIAEVNPILAEQPEMLNKAPETEGWLVKIKSTTGLTGEFLSKEEYDAVASEDS